MSCIVIQWQSQFGHCQGCQEMLCSSAADRHLTGRSDPAIGGCLSNPAQLARTRGQFTVHVPPRNHNPRGPQPRLQRNAPVRSVRARLRAESGGGGVWGRSAAALHQHRSKAAGGDGRRSAPLADTLHADAYDPRDRALTLREQRGRNPLCAGAHPDPAGSGRRPGPSGSDLHAVPGSRRSPRVAVEQIARQVAHGCRHSDT